MTTDPEIIDRLARIETKLDQTTDLRARVDRLERFMWLALGISLASGGSSLTTPDPLTMPDRLPEPIRPGAVAHDPPCPACGHDHLWLDCDWCDCHAHVRTGIYD